MVQNRPVEDTQQTVRIQNSIYCKRYGLMISIAGKYDLFYAYHS